MGRQTYSMSTSDGIYTFDAEYQKYGWHQLSATVYNSSSSNGVITVKLLSPGGQYFESFDNNTIDMSNYRSILLTFCVKKFQFTLSNFESGGTLVIFDNILQF